MKILLTIAATLAVFTSVSAASAGERTGGHYEWQNRIQPRPNKSNMPSRVRVWVKHGADMASCDCAIMRNEAAKAACMAMPTKGKTHSKG